MKSNVRAAPLVLILGGLWACADPNVAPTCPAGFELAGEAFECVAIDALSSCPIGFRMLPNGSDCAAVGVGACQPGFQQSSDGWGCEAVAPDGCRGGLRARIGVQTCLAAGWVSCPPGFERDTARGACRAVVADAPCDGPRREVLGKRACQPVGDCEAPFPPPEATMLVAEDLDADGFAGGIFSSVSEALAAASPGEVIAIEAGVYAESIRIDTSVSLVGRCAGDVTIVGDGVRSGVVVRGTPAQLRGLSLVGHGVGLEVADHAAVTATEVVIEHNVSYGALVRDGATLELAHAVVRNTRRDVRGEGHGLVVRGASLLMLDGVEIGDHPGSGLFVSEATATGHDLVLRNAGTGVERDDAGLSVELGGRLDLERVALLDHVSAAIRVRGLMTEAQLAFVDVRGTKLSDVGISVIDRGHLFLSDARVVGEGGVGLSFATGAQGDLRRVSVLMGRNDGAPGAPGVVASQGACVTAVESVIDSATGIGAVVRDSGSVFDLRESVVSNVFGDDSIGVMVGAGAELVASGATIEDAGAVGISVGPGGSVRLEQTLVRRARGSSGGGGLLANDAEVQVILSAISGNVGAGIAVVGASGRATVIDSAVSQQLGGPGLYLGEGATLTLARSTVSDNTSVGIFAERKSTLLLAESLVSRTRSVAGAQDGHGIYTAGTLRMTKSVVTDNGAAGIFLDGVTAPASIAESLVAKSEWTPDRALGYGVALRGSAVQIFRSELRDNLGAGLLFDSSAALVTSSLVARNGTGVHAQSGTELVSVDQVPDALQTLEALLVAGTRFVANAVREGEGVLALPEPPAPPTLRFAE